MSMLIEVWGSYGCFTRPEMKTERVSYAMPTPSAARGLVEAIYWHPGLRYTVDRIYLLKPFGREDLRRAIDKLGLLAAAAPNAGPNTLPT